MLVQVVGDSQRTFYDCHCDSVTLIYVDLEVSYQAFDYIICCDSGSFGHDLLSVWLEIIVIHNDSQSFGHALSSVWLLKLLWITIIWLWPIKRVNVEITVHHDHSVVTYRACDCWNYCDLSSVWLLKLLWIMIICLDLSSVWLLKLLRITIICRDLSSMLYHAE